LPLQLHLDQGQLNFLISFFQNESSNSNPHLSYENEIVGMDSTTYGSAAIVDEALLPFFQVFELTMTVSLLITGLHRDHMRTFCTQ
jgi:autophagy-related protein 2